MDAKEKKYQKFINKTITEAINSEAVEEKLTEEAKRTIVYKKGLQVGLYKEKEERKAFEDIVTLKWGYNRKSVEHLFINGVEEGLGLRLEIESMIKEAIEETLMDYHEILGKELEEKYKYEVIFIEGIKAGAVQRTAKESNKWFIQTITNAFHKNSLEHAFAKGMEHGGLARIEFEKFSNAAKRQASLHGEELKEPGAKERYAIYQIGFNHAVANSKKNLEFRLSIMGLIKDDYGKDSLEFRLVEGIEDGMKECLAVKNRLDDLSKASSGNKNNEKGHRR
jgi:hypothetical protein